MGFDDPSNGGGRVDEERGGRGRRADWLAGECAGGLAGGRAGGRENERGCGAAPSVACRSCRAGCVRARAHHLPRVGIPHRKSGAPSGVHSSLRCMRHKSHVTTARLSCSLLSSSISSQLAGEEHGGLGIW